MTVEASGSESRVRRALSLSLVNTAIGKVSGLLVGIALARILVPEEFGVFAVALVALNGILSFNELGVSLAIVRWRGNPQEIVSTVTTISMLSSALLYVGCWFGAPSFAVLMGAPDATGVVRLLCLSVLVDGMTAAAAQLVNRDFRQGTRLAVDTTNLVITTGVTVGLALGGHGAWSLAWGQLVGNLLSALLLFRLVSRWPRPGFDYRHAVSLLAFGMPLAGASVVVFAMLNIDYLVIGWQLDAAALGLYLLAFNLSSWPVSTFSTVVRRVSLAAFSEVRDHRVRRQDVFVRMAVMLALPSLPACALLSALALPTITTLYGQKWAAAAAALQFLAVFGLVRVFSELAYDFLIALGEARRCLSLQVLWLLGLAVALPVGARIGGIEGVAMGQALVALVLVLPLFLASVARIGIGLGRLGQALLRPVVGCLALVAAVAVVRWLTEPSLVQLLVGGVAGAAVYLPVVWPLRHIFRTPSEVGS